MGMFFTVGEKKIRPGVYQRYENRGTSSTAGAVNGIVAATYRSNWGPVGEVQTIGSDEAGNLQVLIGKNGIARNVLAFQPPLVITEENINDLLNNLGDVLALVK